MDIELGIAVDTAIAQRHPREATALAQRAEERGLDLVVVQGTGGTALDPWTLAAWLAGATSRIAIGLATPAVPDPDPTDVEAPYPAVRAKALDSIDALSRGRMMTDASAWVLAPRGAGPAEVEALAAASAQPVAPHTTRPVVVPVETIADVDRVAAFVPERVGAGRRRPAAVRAKRVAGIDYDGVPASLAGRAVEPGDHEHRSVSSTYLRGGAPGLVLRPRTPAEVADALAFARRHPEVELGIRSAGHGISGRSTNHGGIVIDVGAMDAIEVLDAARRLVRIGPGATWKRVAEALTPYGWALGSGDYGGVGVGGLATAGGIGLLSRHHGLTIDHLRAVEVVLADGSLVRATATEHPDLFWAVRGAGANFGIATAFEFEVDEVGEVGWAQLSFATGDLEQSLLRYGELASAAPRDTTVFLVTGQPQQGMYSLQLFAIVDDPDADTVVERLTPFLELGMLTRQQVVMTSYAGVMGSAADIGPEGQHGFGEPHSRSAFVLELTPEFARDAARMLQTGAVYFFELRAMGGAIGDVDPGEMAYSHRSPAFQVAAMGGDDARLDRVWDPLQRHFDGLYLSFETERTPEKLREAFPAPVLRRLHELKRRYDPANVFRDNFNIDPDDDTLTRAPAGASFIRGIAREAIA
ncbi:LLM class flavin-dependent oxidoreductase [Microbacterium sp. BWT-B31]|uniref:LLM class flavin-dependent oxidoreductase n=1 Tax=Microbacterium sp. BWT-B31 TaxID=3232072 RepID=UPI003527A569